MASHDAYCLLTEEEELSTFQEALRSSYVSLWMTTMQEEMEASRKTIGCKWVYKIKRDGNDQVERYRARLVLKGYAQKEGIDFNEIFSPVVRMTTIRIVLAMCAVFDLHLEQLDVKTAFLHGELEEEIYMLQPEGFKTQENLVCRLTKSLYGLKQAPICWYKRFDSFIISLGYNRLSSDHCTYYNRFGNTDFVILLLYVDDMLVGCKSTKTKKIGIFDFLKRITYKRSCGTSTCKTVSQFLSPLPINYKLSSSMCPSSEEERMEMSRVPYASAVGSLMYAMICTRPDFAQAVGVVSKFMGNPGGEHWNAIKRILRYIKGTSGVALCYGGSELLVRGYVDSDFAGDVDKRKSTTGYVFTIAGGAVSWLSKLQDVIALSTTEAEYMAATQACKEAIWIKKVMEELGHKQQQIVVYCDSQSALHIARNPAFHSRTKHIAIRYHFVREVVEEGSVDMQKIHTDENLADVMTKSINTNNFIWFRSSYGLLEM
ncbi:hypothetical protein CR513_33050, partial [Mucuna pruriens]